MELPTNRTHWIAGAVAAATFARRAWPTSHTGSDWR